MMASFISSWLRTGWRWFYPVPWTFISIHTTRSSAPWRSRAVSDVTSYLYLLLCLFKPCRLVGVVVIIASQYTAHIEQQRIKKIKKPFSWLDIWSFPCRFCHLPLCLLFFFSILSITFAFKKKIVESKTNLKRLTSWVLAEREELKFNLTSTSMTWFP